MAGGLVSGVWWSVIPVYFWGCWCPWVAGGQGGEMASVCEREGWFVGGGLGIK